jgi:hypothetical protein
MPTPRQLPFVESRDVKLEGITDEVMLHIALKPALARTERNVQDARRELFTLITVVGAILERRPDRPPGERQKAISEIYKNAIRFRRSLNKGAYSLVQTAAEADGREWGDEASRADDLCAKMQKFLNSFVSETEKQRKKLHLRARAGRGPNAFRQEAVIECARYFKRWSTHRVSYADEAPFSGFVREVFRAAGAKRLKALNRQIRNAMNAMNKSH